MPTLVVDPTQYAHAAESMAGVARSTQAAVGSLASELGATSGMGGSDNAGVEWATSYDQGARAALQAAASAVGASGNVAARLHATGANHAQADASSTLGGGDSTIPGAPTSPTMSEPSVPSAAGGSGGGPPGWSLVEGLVGYAWPNGHQDRLHAADAAWKSAAAQLQDAAGPTGVAASTVGAQQSPESAAAAQACTDTGNHLRDLSSVFTQIGTSCTEYAAHLDEAHHEIISTLKELIIETAAIEAAGAAFAIFTAGLDEIAAQAAVAARIATAAAKIRRVIEALIDAARGIAAAAKARAARAFEVLAKLKPMEEGAVKRASTSEAAAPTTLRTAAAKPPTQQELLDRDWGDLDQLYKTEPNTAHFWSGRTSSGQGVGPRTLIDGTEDPGFAAQLAKDRGGVTLESLQRERGIEGPAWSQDPAVKNWWEAHSAAYANNASGEVTAVLGRDLRPGNVWEGVELGRLMDNPAVSRINTIDAETGEVTTIFAR